jgi:hypothetical protein
MLPNSWNHRCLLQIRGRGWPTLHRHLRCAPGNDQSRGCRRNLVHIHHTVHRDLKELALQVLDIVSIRPDLKIAYIGLSLEEEMLRSQR